MVLDYPFVWPLWNAAENSQRQTCELGLTFSESTTRDGLRLASRTPNGIYGQCNDLTFALAAFSRATSSILISPLRSRWASGSRHIVSLATDARCMAFSRPFFCAFDDRTLITSRPIVGRICTDKRACVYEYRVVVPQAQSGRNSYRNLVSGCLECNSWKGERSATDFLRWLYRKRGLTAAELNDRLLALASGKLRPQLPAPFSGRCAGGR
jgi:hypothetical protein